jgi:lactate dehydrogenase-like 2-hydroxyacid dehydrogenase
MKIVILDALTYGETSLAGFMRFGDVETYQTTAPEQVLERISGADVIVTNKVVIADETMAQAPALKLICVAATGTNNIDLEAAEKRGIPVKNVAGYSTDSVVQHTFSLLFYLAGHSRYYDEYVKSGEWQKSPVFTHVGRPFHELKGKKWGIIGLGQIGRGVANVAQAFGAEVCYYSASGKQDTPDFRRVDLPELLRECDIVSVHAPLNDATYDLLDYDAMKQLKPGAILMNLGRGGIVNEEALAKVMDEQLLYAGLDVLEREPMADPHPLMAIKHPERLYITPHIAWTSVEARERLIATVIENIQTFLDG